MRKKRNPFGPHCVYASVVNLANGQFLALAEISWESGHMETRRIAVRQTRPAAAQLAKEQATIFAKSNSTVMIDTTADVVNGLVPSTPRQ